MTKEKINQIIEKMINRQITIKIRVGYNSAIASTQINWIHFRSRMISITGDIVYSGNLVGLNWPGVGTENNLEFLYRNLYYLEIK